MIMENGKRDGICVRDRQINRQIERQGQILTLTHTHTQKEREREWDRQR